ncbi:hypothetical protein LOD99_9040 [Oopsacas minuta]|uniref:Tc1-like transposase DDE domain-containing protein n=1 Tax=Oopsacas minuta TaxID=111878 RepID=A0AAV7JEF6_9METZ|nr:hypothetical protein LOD99_9040 [Oopsacas minuta]
MAAEVHISKGSMQNLVKNELDFRSYKRKTVHFLSETIKLKRLSRSKGLLTRLEIENLDRFLFSDEKLFSIEQATNKQNDRILAPNSSSIPEDVLNQPFVFQQDDAPAHTANITRKWLHENISGFLSKEEWPPSSPDLNPMDFSIWAILETKACAKSHNNLDSLKRSLVKEWEKIPQEVLRAAVESFPTRLRSVVKNKGGYKE